jgi:tetratricopeptide (TPR) repeat protein
VLVAGRIRERGLDRGSAFPIAPRLVVTANHCIRGCDLAALRFAVDGREIVVEDVEQDESLDVALLRLVADAPSPLTLGECKVGAGWRVESQPRENDPMLSGTINADRWRITNRRGHVVEAIQMQVDQELDSHEGYSGSPVTSPPGTAVVVGVLVEQLPSRARLPPGELALSANVLYAVSIGDVVDRFGLAARGVVAPRSPDSSAPRPRREIAERVSGLRVATAVDHWRDRDELIAELRDVLLDSEHRVISIVGRRGIGKSALVAKVLAEFERFDATRDPGDDLSPLVYMSGRRGGLTLAAVYQRVADLWDPASAKELALRWQSAGFDGLAAMWDEMRDRRPVLVLDNLDDLQRPVTRELEDPGLEALLDSACRTTCRATVVTTSQVPLALPADLAPSVHVVEIVDGLNSVDAVALIRASATRGAARLESISDASLAGAAARVEGVPRGLQKLALMLDRRPAMIKRLIDSKALPEEVLQELVSTTYSEMRATDQLVMQVLALAAAPLGVADMASLLDGLLDRAAVENTVDRLIDAGEVSEHIETALLELHPLDADHIRGVLVDGDRERQVRLDNRLADWWAGRAEPVDCWRTLDDVRPSKREYVHRWRAGDRARALRVIADAAEWLTRWGEGVVVAAAVRAAREELDPADVVGRFRALLCEARVEFFVGSLDTSLAALLDARELAQGAGLLDEITDLDLWIGAAYRHRNEPAAAIAILERIADAPVDALVTRIERQIAVFDLGLSLLYDEQLDRAAQAVQQLDALVQSGDSARSHALCANLKALDAIARCDYDAAKNAANAAIAHYDRTTYWINRGYVLNVRGLALLARGDTQSALVDLLASTQMAGEYHHERMHGLSATNLAWAYLRAGDYDAAVLSAELAADRLASAGVTIAPAARALAGAIRAARAGARVDVTRDALAHASELARGNPDIHSPSHEFLDTVSAALGAAETVD